MRLALFTLFISLSCQAAITGDVMLQWDGIARGAVANSTALASGTKGNYDGWHPDALSRYSIVAAPTNYTFPAPITISNVTYDGSSTNWLQSDTANGTANVVEDAFLLFANGGSGINDVAVCGYVQLNQTNGSNLSLDIHEITPISGGHWSVFQIRPQTGSVSTVIETQDGSGNSQFGTVLTGLVQSKVYYYQHVRRASGTSRLRLFNPDAGYVEIGETTGATGNGTCYEMFFISGYSAGQGNSDKTIKWGPAVVLYNPTDATLTNLVTSAVVGPVLTGGNATFGNVSFR